MELGERIKKRRKELGISVDFVAKELGVSVSTVYRYEDSSIEKIPVHVFDSLCRIPVSYTHLDVYKRQQVFRAGSQTISWNRSAHTFQPHFSECRE